MKTLPPLPPETEGFELLVERPMGDDGKPDTEIYRAIVLRAIRNFLLTTPIHTREVAAVYEFAARDVRRVKGMIRSEFPWVATRRGWFERAPRIFDEARAAWIQPEVIQRKPFSVQVCVPAVWQDNVVIAFAERENPCGTENGWQIRKFGEWPYPVRVPCAKIPGYVHIVLDA